MLTYNSEDVFNAEKSPEIGKELDALKEQTAHTPIYFKVEIIISYLKNHSIQNTWIAANPELVRLLLSNRLITRHIESLFDFCRMKPIYSRDFESYIKMKLLKQ